MVLLGFSQRTLNLELGRFEGNLQSPLKAEDNTHLN